MLHMANTIIDVNCWSGSRWLFIILVFLLFRKGQRSDKMQSFVWGLLKVHFNCFSSNFPKERKTFRPFFCPQLQLIIFCERESWVDFIPYYNKEVTLCYYAALLLPKASAHARQARTRLGSFGQKTPCDSCPLDANRAFAENLVIDYDKYFLSYLISK